MPIYPWRYKPTANTSEEVIVQVLRNFDGSNEPPTEEELEQEIPQTLKYLQPYNKEDWERIVARGIKASRAPGWGSKGNW